MPLPDGLTSEALKRYLSKELDADDEFLEAILGGVAAFAARYTGRTFTPDPAGEDTAVTRTIATPRGRPYLPVPDAARAITAVTVADVAVSGWETVGTPISYLKLAEATQDPVVITGRFGYLPLPDDLTDAIYVHAARRFYEREAGYADAVAPLEEGAVQSYFRMMPANVRATYNAHKVRDLVLA
jgi:hypothetical protein